MGTTYNPAELSRIYSEVTRGAETGALYKDVLWLPRRVREKLEREDSWLDAYETAARMVGDGRVLGKRAA